MSDWLESWGSMSEAADEEKEDEREVDGDERGEQVTGQPVCAGRLASTDMIYAQLEEDELVRLPLD